MNTDTEVTPNTQEGFSLAEIVLLADSGDTVREAAALLRARIAPMKVIVVDALDMRGEAPTAEGARRVLWGASSDGHCWQVSADLSALSGFYLADKA
jgi:hypothetical protein